MWDFVGVLNQFRIYNDIFSPVLIVIANIFDWIAHNNPFVVSVSEVEHEGAQLSRIVDMKRAGFVFTSTCSGFAKFWTVDQSMYCKVAG